MIILSVVAAAVISAAPPLQTSGIQWWSTLPSATVFVVEAQPVAGGVWKPLVTLSAATTCKEVQVVGSTGAPRLFCQYGPTGGVPSHSYFRVRNADATVGGLAYVWPTRSHVAVEGCP